MSVINVAADLLSSCVQSTNEQNRLCKNKKMKKGNTVSFPFLLASSLSANADKKGKEDKFLPWDDNCFAAIRLESLKFSAAFFLDSNSSLFKVSPDPLYPNSTNCRANSLS